MEILQITLALALIAISSLSLVFLLYNFTREKKERRIRAQLEQVRKISDAVHSGATYEEIWDMPMPRKLRKQLVKRLGKPRAES